MAKLKDYSYYVQNGELKGHKLYILATSRKKVVEMLSDHLHVTTNEVKNYFLNWGSKGEDIMKDIDKTEPFVYCIEMPNSGFGKPTSELKRLV